MLLLIFMSSISQVRGLILRVEGTLDLNELAERAIRAHEALERFKGQISPRQYKLLERALGLGELKGEDNCFSGYYH